MPSIIIPKHESVVWEGANNKNYIKRLWSDEVSVELNVIDVGAEYLVLRNNGIEICLSSSGKNFPDEYDYVLLASSPLTEDTLESGDVELKSWLKHPDEDESTAIDIVNSWKNDYFFIEEDIEADVAGLRTPQVGAIYSVLSHLKVGDDLGTVVLPTGTGKTEVMLSALVANRCERLLVTVPTDALRNQIFNKFLTLGLLKKFGIIGDKALYPKVGFYSNRFDTAGELEEFLLGCNVIVATMAVVSASPMEQQLKMNEVCSHLFIDEAHHVKAKSWDSFRKIFDNNKVVQFTATPFRNDQKRLDGDIIFNFSLKKAQEQGYFKKINFISFREYESQEADRILAGIAVEKLREDIEAGYNHILMARCATKKRAIEVFEYYREHEDMNPTCIYSKVKGQKKILKDIQKGEHKIIVCVDMLGEGFDLPELKIAAFHDIRKSLPVTLQYAGRFTRTSRDSELGEASFIANLADLNVKDELDDLYAQDADWNLLLSEMSKDEVEDEVEFQKLISGFGNLDNSAIPFQNIRPALSVVAYRGASNQWTPENFANGIRGYDNLEYRFHDLNADMRLLVIITADRINVDWGRFDDIFELVWDEIIVYHDVKSGLLFIHGSDKSGFYGDLARAVIGDYAEIINEAEVYKAFYGIKRITLQNVGLKEFFRKHIRYRMCVGSDVGEALSRADKEQGQKSSVFGVGYEGGEKVSIGCSYKGRIWSYMKGDLKQLTDWCKKLGKKLSDETIDSNQVLQDTLIPDRLAQRPDAYPVWIDWHEHLYKNRESMFTFLVDGIEFNLADCELQISSPSTDNPIQFDFATDESCVTFQVNMFSSEFGGEALPDYSITKISQQSVRIRYGSKDVPLEEYFNENTPIIWFADGSALAGNEYVKRKGDEYQFNRNNIEVWDWEGVDISNESQHVFPKVEDSIQYRVIDVLKEQDVDIVYDDDYKGEIADVVTIKKHKDKLSVKLYHLKYAVGGNVGNQIANFYEVCGQAQKSMHWRHRSGDEFINHLLRREQKRRGGHSCSRLEKGTTDDLEKLLHIAKKKIPIEFDIFIVQPSLSKQGVSNDILTLLGVTESFLKEFSGIDLGVIASE